jgi:hypothetical protein
MDSIDSFLLETKYCNFNNPAIKKLAQDLTRGCVNDQEKAVKLFYWVRDNIQYRFGPWNKIASDILRDGRGMCTNKAVLLTSLLRAEGIHAGFGILKVKGQEYFGPIAPIVLSGRVSKLSVHFYSYVFLDKKWIKIDPSVDIDLAQKTNYFNPTTQLTEWLGSEDATENLDPSHIISDEGPFASVESHLRKKPRSISRINFFVGNLYLDFLRSNKIKIVDPKQLGNLFESWLKKNKFFYYFLFKIYINIK